MTSIPMPEAEQLGKDPTRVQQMFAQVAPKYDQANTVLSLGIHHLWRKKLVKLSDLRPGDQVLDCATGTGDLALEFKAREPRAQVTGTDFCEQMLDHAPLKSKARGLDAKFLWADATNLPFPEASFDIVTISFGIRNVSNPTKAISEMHRVLKPGGRLLVLEFGQPRLPGIAQLYNFYALNVLPRIGGWVTGQRDAYSYLQKSSANFPCGRDFIDLMKQAAPFTQSEAHALTGGIAYLYKATK